MQDHPGEQARGEVHSRVGDTPKSQKPGSLEPKRGGITDAHDRTNKALDRNIADYIARERKKGFSPDEIRLALIKVGHSLDTIERHMGLVDGQAPPQKSHPYLEAGLVFFILLCFAAAGVYFFNTNAEDAGMTSKEIGMKLISMGRYDTAITYLEDAVRRDPDDADSYYWLGQAHYLKDDNEEALTWYRKALELNPSHAPSLIGIAAIYYWGGQYDDAIRLANDSYEIAPDDVRTVRLLGAAYAEKGVYDKAQRLIIMSMSMNSSNPYADAYGYFFLARYYYLIGRYSIARDYIEKSLAYDFTFRRERVLQLEKDINAALSNSTMQ